MKILDWSFSIYRIFKKYLLLPFSMGSPTNSCRYYPTCSHYCHQAIKKHGIFKGLLLGSRRVIRCHPYSNHPHIDPVP